MKIQEHVDDVVVVDLPPKQDIAEKLEVVITMMQQHADRRRT
jgi:hypothetical protein